MLVSSSPRRTQLFCCLVVLPSYALILKWEKELEIDISTECFVIRYHVYDNVPAVSKNRM